MQTPATNQTTPQAPTPPPTPGVAVSAEPVIAPATISNATLEYQAAKAARSALADQVQALEQTRHALLRELEDHNVPGPARTGMEQRIVQIDQRIVELDKAIIAADAQVVKTAGVPGAVIEPPPQFEGGGGGGGADDELVVFAMLFASITPLVILFLARKWRQWRGKDKAPTTTMALPRELGERLFQLESTTEATALEIERIGEGQRFLTKLLMEKEKVALPQGAKHTG
ncbi:MAG TPA: hypothetical protein VM939_09655 [Gemmatimonadaceae bacterium]|nr:hypothetical protein [Gemmatimonadaceae bacterium]